jgi:hypothetical protein
MKFSILFALMLSCVVCIAVLGNTPSGQGDNPPQVAICQRTNSDTHPFALKTVAAPSLSEHIAQGAVYPVDGACPEGPTKGGVESDPGAVPEPLTILLFGSGLAGVGYATRRWRKNGTAVDDEQV